LSAQPVLEDVSLQGVIGVAPQQEGHDFSWPTRFSALPVFGTSAAGPATLASPALARAWAEAIVSYWQAGVADKSIEESKPLYLLDQTPAQGQFTWMLLNALQARLSLLGLNWQPCYVACCNTADEAQSLLSHPYFDAFIANGWLDVALRDGLKSNALQLQRQGMTVMRTDNPIVILSLGYLQTLPSELYGVHEGKFMKATVESSLSNESDEVIELRYDWQPHIEGNSSEKGVSDVLLQHMLYQYRHRFTSTIIQLPLTACGVLDTFAKISSGRYLLLAAEKGVSSEQHIRLGGLTPPNQWRVGDAPPLLNLHALSVHQQEQGAWVWNDQLEEASIEGNKVAGNSADGVVLHVALRHDERGANQNSEIDKIKNRRAKSFESILTILEDAHPTHLARLIDCVADLPTEMSVSTQRLSILRSSNYDPRVLKAAMAGLHQQPLSLSETARRDWTSALVRTWRNYLPLPHDDIYGNFYRDVAIFAAQLGHWGLAQECLCLGLNLFCENALDLHHLAYCEASTGATDDALSRLARAIDLAPDDESCQQLYAELYKRQQAWDACTWYDPTVARDKELRLEPLGSEHVSSLLYQYRDPQIAEMTRLPVMHTAEDVEAWMAEQAEDAARMTYAVMHACWGFVGMVNVHCADKAGYFYFWMGSDFQDRGLGQRATALLFRQTDKLGVRDIYTSAYTDNQRSLHALKRVGFKEVSLRALEPDERLIFLYLRREATAINGDEVKAGLKQLCTAIESPMCFED